MIFEAVILLCAEVIFINCCDMGIILLMLQTTEDIPGIKCRRINNASFQVNK